jgi:hypothetical protein
MPFDIASLRAFDPSQYQCEKCLALLRRDLSYTMERHQPITCPICHVVYRPTEDFPDELWEHYINRYRKICLNPTEALTQAQQLAEIAQGTNLANISFTPVRNEADCTAHPS